MQPMTADVNQLSGRRGLPAMASRSDFLIKRANGKECHNDAEDNSHAD
jgi:hypothetical protein